MTTIELCKMHMFWQLEISFDNVYETLMWFYVSPLLRLQGKSRWAQRGQDRGRVRLKPILHAVLVQNQLSLWTHVGWQGSENVDNRKEFWLWIPPRSHLWPWPAPKWRKSHLVLGRQQELHHCHSIGWGEGKPASIFCPKNLCSNNIVCTKCWDGAKPLQYQFGLNTIAYNAKPLQHHLACRCQTFSWSSPWLFRHLGFLPWECWEWARLRDCDWNWTTSCHRHRDHTSPQYWKW